MDVANKIMQNGKQIKLNASEIYYEDNGVSKSVEQVLKNKANIEQEGLKTLAPNSGWVGIINYRKNTVGTVFVEGQNISPATTNPDTSIARLPEGYRPRGNYYSLVFLGNISPYHTLPAISVAGTGDIFIQKPALDSVPGNKSNAYLTFSIVFDSV